MTKPLLLVQMLQVGSQLGTNRGLKSIDEGITKK
jgi:hypothetical protein